MSFKYESYPYKYNSFDEILKEHYDMDTIRYLLGIGTEQPKKELYYGSFIEAAKSLDEDNKLPSVWIKEDWV